MKTPTNPMLLFIDYEPDDPLPWAVENNRSAARNQRRAVTREKLLEIIGEHLQQLEMQVTGQ